MTPPPVAIHRPGNTLLFPRGPPPIPASCTSFLHLCCKSLCMGVSRSGPLRGKTCRIGVIMGGLNYPPKRPLSNYKRGGAGSVPGGRSNWSPDPVNPSWGPPILFPDKGKKPDISGVPSGGGGGVASRSHFPTPC